MYFTVRCMQLHYCLSSASLPKWWLLSVAGDLTLLELLLLIILPMLLALGLALRMKLFRWPPFGLAEALLVAMTAALITDQYYKTVCYSDDLSLISLQFASANGGVSALAEMCSTRCLGHRKSKQLFTGSVLNYAMICMHDTTVQTWDQSSCSHPNKSCKEGFETTKTTSRRVIVVISTYQARQVQRACYSTQAVVIALVAAAQGDMAQQNGYYVDTRTTPTVSRQLFSPETTLPLLGFVFSDWQTFCCGSHWFRYNLQWLCILLHTRPGQHTHDEEMGGWGSRSLKSEDTHHSTIEA